MGFDNLDNLFVKVFESNPCPMAISEIMSGKYIRVNRALLSILGYSEVEMVGKTTAELCIFSIISDRQKALAIAKKSGNLRDFETIIQCKNGRLVNALFNAEFVTIKGKQYLLTVMEDITAKKQLEEEITRLDRLNLIGQMAAGISHEVRNPMTTVRGFLQLYIRKLENEKQRETFELMISELDRANAILSEFLSISKVQATSESKQCLRKTLETIKPLIEAESFERGAKLRFLLDNTPQVFVNEKEIRQMTLNLVRNGIDAMPSGGELTIQTEYSDNKVILSVIDQGVGFDQSILDKLGTPFVTTKESGTGLGLAVCMGIAQRHNADFQVKSSSQGTTISVCFLV